MSSASRMSAKTIQIFLPTGEPRGIRIAEITTRIVQAVAIPRSDLVTARTRPELNQVALYFLIGEAEGAAKPLVYIGQTEDVDERLRKHDATKDFWQVAVLIISRTQSFTQAHIRYLEWHCIQQAKSAGRFQIENGNAGSEPFVTEPIEADLSDIYDTLTVLVSTLGYPIFDPVARSQDSSDRFFLRTHEVNASGNLVEDGFVVYQGALGRVGCGSSVQAVIDQVESIRRPLQESGVVVEEQGKLRFTEDYLFRSPSGAAVSLLGRSANGWVEWKDDRGRTLHEMRRERVEDR